MEYISGDDYNARLQAIIYTHWPSYEARQKALDELKAQYTPVDRPAPIQELIQERQERLSAEYRLKHQSDEMRRLSGG